MFFALVGVVTSLSVYTPPASARCPLGFTGRAGYNYCIPKDLAARKIYLDCALEQNQLGLPKVSPCISEASKIKIIDNYIYYCRKAKLPNLMR